MTLREPNVSQASVSHSVYNWPHGYSVTAPPCYGAVGTHPIGMLSCSSISVVKGSFVGRVISPEFG